MPSSHYQQEHMQILLTGRFWLTFSETCHVLHSLDDISSNSSCRQVMDHLYYYWSGKPDEKDPQVDEFIKRFDLEETKRFPGPLLGLTWEQMKEAYWKGVDDLMQTFTFPIAEGYSLAWHGGQAVWAIEHTDESKYVPIAKSDGHPENGALRACELLQAVQIMRANLVPEDEVFSACLFLIFSEWASPENEEEQTELVRLQRQAVTKIGLVQSEWEWQVLEVCRMIHPSRIQPWIETEELGWVLDDSETGKGHHRSLSSSKKTDSEYSDFGGPNYLKRIKAFTEMLEQRSTELPVDDRSSWF